MTSTNDNLAILAVDFRSKIPKDAPIYDFVLKGALDFTCSLGTVDG